MKRVGERMLRIRLGEGLKAAMRARDEHAVSTMRLVLAALKDRGTGERGKGNAAGLSEEQILGLLQSMIKQRHESIRLYEQGGRHDLAQREADEIAIIGQFLPRQMDEQGMRDAVAAIVSELGAKTLRDMGRVMAVLKERYAGQMNMTKAAVIAKHRLS
jgi:uncharacterized protein